MVQLKRPSTHKKTCKILGVGVTKHTHVGTHYEKYPTLH